MGACSTFVPLLGLSVATTKPSVGDSGRLYDSIGDIGGMDCETSSRLLGLPFSWRSFDKAYSYRTQGEQGTCSGTARTLTISSRPSASSLFPCKVESFSRSTGMPCNPPLSFGTMSNTLEEYGIRQWNLNFEPTARDIPSGITTTIGNHVSTFFEHRRYG